MSNTDYPTYHNADTTNYNAPNGNIWSQNNYLKPLYLRYPPIYQHPLGYYQAYPGPSSYTHSYGHRGDVTSMPGSPRPGTMEALDHSEVDEWVDDYMNVPLDNESLLCQQPSKGSALFQGSTCIPVNQSHDNQPIGPPPSSPLRNPAVQKSIKDEGRKKRPRYGHVRTPVSTVSDVETRDKKCSILLLPKSSHIIVRIEHIGYHL